MLRIIKTARVDIASSYVCGKAAGSGFDDDSSNTSNAIIEFRSMWPPCGKCVNITVHYRTVQTVPRTSLLETKKRITVVNN